MLQHHDDLKLPSIAVSDDFSRTSNIHFIKTTRCNSSSTVSIDTFFSGVFFYFGTFGFFFPDIAKFMGRYFSEFLNFLFYTLFQNCWSKHWCEYLADPENFILFVILAPSVGSFRTQGIKLTSYFRMTFLKYKIVGRELVRRNAAFIFGEKPVCFWR